MSMAHEKVLEKQLLAHFTQYERRETYGSAFATSLESQITNSSLLALV